MPSYETHYRCSIHGWVPKFVCLNSAYGIVCGLCRDEGVKTRVRTRPKYTNSAGSFVRDLKESLYFTSKGDEPQ